MASSVLAERLPAMCGSETLTTVVSSTSMKVLDMTAMAMSQGLISARGVGVALIYFVGFAVRRIPKNPTAEDTELQRGRNTEITANHIGFNLA